MKRKAFIFFLALVMVAAYSLPALNPGAEVQAASNPYPTTQDWDGDGNYEVPCTRFAWQCAYDRMGVALPSWGNAVNWWNGARNAGYATGSTPMANSIAVWSGGGAGHVAYVTSGSGNTFTVDEGGRTDLDHTSSHGVAYGYTLTNAVGGARPYDTGKTLLGFIYLGGTPSAPTVASVSIPKTSYAVDEKVVFSINANGNVTNLWIYCPNGQTLTYKNVGSSYTLGFGMSGYFEALVETWNGIGSKKSSRISWRVGKPTKCDLKIAKSSYELKEKVQFDISADGSATNLWIYCPNGQTLTYKDVGSTFSLRFALTGHYEALAETWNGIGSKQSARVSWNVVDPAPPVCSTHKWDDGKITKPATETEEGEKLYTCTVCEQTKTEAIPKLAPAPAQPSSEGDGSADTAGTAGNGTTGTESGMSASVAEAAIISCPSDEGPAGTSFAPLKLKSTKQTKKSVKLTWTPAAGATNYIIYGNQCGKGKGFRRITEVSGKSSLNITKAADRKLQKGKYYKFIVVAVDKDNKVVSLSKAVHAATKGGKVGNHKKVTVKKSVVAKAKKLKAGKSLKLKAKAVKGKLKVRNHRAVSYESSNPAVATVSKKGVVKGISKGSCYVYAYAQNGVYKSVKVIVK